MAFNRSLRHHTLRASAVLPLFDGIFAVALTLIAFNVPDMLAMGMGAHQLLVSLLAYGVSALVVVVYWFKLRRLIGLCRFLHLPQMTLLAQAMLTICLYPKLASLVLLYGQQPGTVFVLTRGQLANTAFLFVLFLFDTICLLFAWTLVIKNDGLNRHQRILRHAIRTQLYGFLLLAAMALLELFTPWFNGQYVYLVPIVLLAEEIGLAYAFGRVGGID
jgi:uncharacterized membrane protein